MYAVIKTGGKQYRVSPGDKLRVESLKAGEGEVVEFADIYMVGDGDSVSIGTPFVSGAQVRAKVLSHGRGKKIRIIKFKRRKHYQRRMGHRQNYTELEIVSVNGVTAGGSNKTDDGAVTESTRVEPRVSGRAAPIVGSSMDTSSAETSMTALKFLDSPNGEPDDLKKILGIGSVLEEKLNEMGIFHFHQIAGLSVNDVDSINAQLNFSGRIERDEWIVQAVELKDGGEGRTLKYLDGPEGEPDDLKLISGVGPVLEGRLNELGIFHFWQIARFEQKDIDLVNEAMAFPGRIERDEWIDQADHLAKGGEPR